MSRSSLRKYKTRSWPSYNTALKQRGFLSIWLDAEMEWHARATSKRGRTRTFWRRVSSLSFLFPAVSGFSSHTEASTASEPVYTDLQKTGGGWFSWGLWVNFPAEVGGQDVNV